MTPPQFPEIGESAGDFVLLAELGRGRQGRVFLATQPTLADRLVVLKVTPRHDQEFLSLARLQHTHIIPLYGVHDLPGRNLRALCQPYFGGATLAKVLEAMRCVPLPERTGRTLVEALDRFATGSHLPIPERGPRETLLRWPYTKAICWLGACLADALQYAHERGLVHLDIKPSNVLLAADAQPLLLDFHLALHPLASGQAVLELMGGTPAYMSPEQRTAYAAGTRRLAAPVAVDGRSDVYSLGKLLYTALGGSEEDQEPHLASLRRCNPQVTPGISAVLHRCLTLSPAERYDNAAGLAADLRRHIADLPLLGVPNRSLRERWGKWRRRRPHALLWVAFLFLLTASIVPLVASAWERYHDASEALREGQQQMQRGSFADAVQTLTRGKARAVGLPCFHELSEQLETCLDEANRACAAARLHAVTERLRFLAGTDSIPDHDRERLITRCREVWKARTLVTGPVRPSVMKPLEEQARMDFIDLVLLWTDLMGRQSGASAAEARAVLAEAETLLGPCATLTRVSLGIEGKVEVANLPTPRTSLEHVILGRNLLRSGNLEQATAELDHAIAARPQDFWAHFYRGRCAFGRKRYADAVLSFSVAIALAPDCPEVYQNRASTYAAMGNTQGALSDELRAQALRNRLRSEE
jgi:serine/threonine protein kinase